MNLPLNKKNTSLPLILFVLLVGILIYSNSFSVPFQFDGRSYLLSNPTIRDISDVGAIRQRTGRSRVLVYLTFALNHYFHGYDVFGYHLVSLVIHLLNALLVWWLCALFLKTPLLKSKIRDDWVVFICFGTALIFVAHPLQTQAVTYIYQRIASLATLFYLLCICSYLKARLSEGRRLKQIMFLFLSLASVLCGMVTKQITFTIPLMILWIEYGLFAKSDRPRYATILLIAVLLLLSLLIPFHYQFSVESTLFRHIDPGAYVEGTITSWTYLLTQSRVLVKYLSLIFFPYGQSIDHYFPLSTSIMDWRVWINSGFLALLAFFGFKSRQRYPLIFVGVSWFFITILVESSIMPIPHVIFEHRMYLPSFGWALLIVALVHLLIPRQKEFVIFIIFLGLVYSVLTYQRNKVWQDEITLWSDAIAKGPENPRPYYNLGYSYMKKKNNQLAMYYYTKALKLKPDYYYALNNRSNLLSSLGKTDLALADITAAIEAQPDKSFLYNSRGTLYQKMNDCTKAIEDFTKGIELDKKMAGPYINRGVCYGKKGLTQLALSDLDKAVEIDPYFPESYNNRGAIYLNNKDYTKALKDFNQALTYDGKYIDAYYNRAITYAALAQNEEALSDFSILLKLDPKNIKARQNRAMLHQQRDEFELALADYNKVLTIQPSNFIALKHRAFLFMLSQRYQEALTDYNTIIEKDPKLAQGYVERAKLYYKLKKYAKAKEDFNLAALLEPDQAEVYFLRALVEYELKELESALADLKKAQKLGHPVDDFYLEEFEKSIESQK